MAAEPAGQIKDLQRFWLYAVILEDDPQTRRVCAFCLSQFVNVGLGKIDGFVTTRVEHDPALPVLEAPEPIHAFCPKQLAEHIHQPGAANSFSRTIADHFHRKQVLRSETHTLDRSW